MAFTCWHQLPCFKLRLILWLACHFAGMLLYSMHDTAGAYLADEQLNGGQLQGFARLGHLSTGIDKCSEFFLLRKGRKGRGRKEGRREGRREVKKQKEGGEEGHQIPSKSKAFGFFFRWCEPKGSALGYCFLSSFLPPARRRGSVFPKALATSKRRTFSLVGEYNSITENHESSRGGVYIQSAVEVRQTKHDALRVGGAWG